MGDDQVFTFGLDLQVEEKGDDAGINNKFVKPDQVEIKLAEMEPEDEDEEDKVPGLIITVKNSKTGEKYSLEVPEGSSYLPDMTAKQAFDIMVKIKDDSKKWTYTPDEDDEDQLQLKVEGLDVAFDLSKEEEE